MNKVFEDENRGYGKHKWDYIDPKEYEFPDTPPSSLERRKRTCALNERSEHVKLDIEDFFNVGIEFVTNMENLPGVCKVVAVPGIKEGHAVTFIENEGEKKTVSLVALGVVPDPVHMTYVQDVSVRISSTLRRVKGK